MNDLGLILDLLMTVLCKILVDYQMFGISVKEHDASNYKLTVGEKSWTLIFHVSSRIFLLNL